MLGGASRSKCTHSDVELPCESQDFMGFLHLGWDVATKADGDETVVVEQTPAWAAVARRVNLNKPGLSIVRQTMAWQPLHMAAMSGDVDLIEELISVDASLCGLATCHMPPAYDARFWAVKGVLDDAMPTENTRLVCTHVAQPGALLQEHKCDLTVRSVNSWTPLHYAAAYNKVSQCACRPAWPQAPTSSAVTSRSLVSSQRQVQKLCR
jgi:hypothetical protein